MLLKWINVRTELVSCVFESDSNSTEVLVFRISIYGGLNALIACNGVRCRSRGVWHRPSELSPRSDLGCLRVGVFT